jgi:NADPH:quinone reductase
MKAIRVEKCGGPEELKLAEIPLPEPGKGEARVRMEAIGLNFIDVYHRIGLYPKELPFTPGSEGAGVVDAVGAGVQEVRVGDRNEPQLIRRRSCSPGMEIGKSS